MHIAYKHTDTPQPFSMEEITLVQMDGDIALTASFEQPEYGKSLIYQVRYHYPESSQVAAIKNFSMDGFLRQEAYYSEKDGATTCYKSYRYKEGQLKGIYINQNNNTQSIEATAKQNLLEKLLFGKQALAKPKDHERFHNEFSISAEDLFKNMKTDGFIDNHINGEIREAQKHDKAFAQSKSHLRIAN